MQARTCRRLIVAALVAASTASAPAQAGIWRQIDTPTTQTITSLEYRSDQNLWFTTSSSIYKRTGTAWAHELNRPGTNFNAIAFNPSGTIGIAVGDAGAFYRNGGGGWLQQPSLMTYNYPYDSCPSSTSSSYTLTSPIVHDLTHVRWVSDSTVFILSGRTGSLMRSVNGGQTWSEINRQANGMCRLEDWIEDVYVLPSNPNHMLFIGGWNNSVFLSTNGLTSTAARRGSACGNRLRVDPNDPARMYVGGLGCYRFGYYEDGGMSSVAPEVLNGTYYESRAFDALGSTALGAGNAGYVFNSIKPAEAYLQPVDGTLATNDWRAADLGSTSTGALGGLNGGLVVSHELDTVPDIIKPTGSISAIATATAGQPVTFTANLADNAGGSGIDADAIWWTRDSEAVGSGTSISLTFPRSGYYTVKVGFRDRTGNAAQASTNISVNAPPIDDTDPTGTISGPAFAVAGQSATFTASASDSGSGIDPSSFSWARDFSGAGRGSSVTMTFPSPGTDTVSVSFADRAGNRSSASVTIPVAPKPEDRPKPVTTNTPPPVVKKQGGRYVIPIKGGYRLPKSVAPKLGCAGEIVFTMKKAKRLVSARTTKLNSGCRYAKSFSVAKSKIGTARTLGITIRFAGNPWLAPVKKTYQVKVPRG